MLEDFADCDADSFGRARGGLAQQVLELGEDLFDRVQVRRVFRQEEELGPGCADELAHRFGFVTTEIVHDHDVAGAKRGDEDLLDIDPEALHPAAPRSCNATLPTASRANWSIGMARWCVSAAKRKPSCQLTHASMIACCRRNCTLAVRSRTQASQSADCAWIPTANVRDGSKSEELTMSSCLPFGPRTRTLPDAAGTSHLCRYCCKSLFASPNTHIFRT